MKYFLTSRYGFIPKIFIYRYDFSETLKSQAKEKLCKWLKLDKSIHLYKISESYFVLFNKLDGTSNQYRFKSAQYLDAPYENIQEVSTFISRLIISGIDDDYKQYHNTNSVIVDNIVLEDYLLLKCVKFNVELFATGRFYIHLYPNTKIINAPELDTNFINKLHNNISEGVSGVNISLRVEKERFRITRDLSDKRNLKELCNFIDLNNDKKVFATFNYRSLAKINPSVFREIQSLTLNIIDKEISVIREVASRINLGICELYKKPFFAFEHRAPSKMKNLVVGGGNIVSKQSAAYHNGMYRGVENTNIRPIYINREGKEIESEFYDKLKRYNGNSNGNKLIKPISIKASEIDSNFELPKSILTERERKTINAVFSEYEIPDDFFDRMYDANQVFQIYVGRPEKYKIDNYAVKCLTKAGGLLNVIYETNENVNTYFIGIDLGHSLKESVLGLTLFSNKGELIRFQTSICNHSEALDTFPLKTAMEHLKRHLDINDLPKAKKIIVHRDGKNHIHDINRLVDSIILVFDVIVIDIVEVIKSGYPIIGCYDNGYLLPNSGDYFKDRDEDYAILVTNTQSKDKNKGQILKPIIIKRKYGRTLFSNLVEQVYWFTKVYTNNLYQSSRLPATTEKANNIVGTGLKRHQSSYLS
ncbi:hypothetical protein CEQ90_20350 [Lewinellaceae bacterium SD302]|nr:hypothetical protein CEQ90_20350 [Lewinellaceae bacterium SD302]